MAKELPYYKFNVAEFLLGRISSEKPAIIGMFVLAGCHYWHKKCDINRSEIEKKVKKSFIKKLISLEYLIEIENKIRIPYLDEQWLELSESKTKQVEGGKKGAAIKYGSPSGLPIALRQDKEEDKIKIGKEKEIFSSPFWLEGICRTYKLGRPFVLEKLTEFVATQKLMSDWEKKSFDDLKDHFVNVIKKIEPADQKQTSGTGGKSFKTNAS